MRRVVIQELLDDDIGSPEEIATSLAELRQVNRLFGGVATTTALLRSACSRRALTDVAVLDVGSGSGDTVLGAAERLGREGIRVRATLLDRKATHLPSKDKIHLVETVVGDALRIPFPDASFDFVACSLLMHHLEPEQVREFVREGLRVARRAVLINDLVRSPIHLALARIGLSVASHMSRFDGTASVRKAYTPDEVRSMLSGIGSSVEVARHYLYRMGITVWK